MFCQEAGISFHSLKVSRLVFLSVHNHYIMVVEIFRKTDTDGQNQIKRRQISLWSSSGFASSAESEMSVHNSGERGKPRALSGVLTVSHLLPFNLRVPGPQDGERGPAVCWVAGSFLQRDLGQCLPQPHGRHHCVRDLQTAWLWDSGTLNSSVSLREGSRPQWVDLIQCRKTDTSLWQCPSDPWKYSSCSPKEEAYISCAGDLLSVSVSVPTL